jgi:predicted permease
MKLLPTIQRLLNSFRKTHDQDAELQSHLQFHIDDNLRSGMSPTEARRQALLRLGGLAQTKQRIQDQHTLPIAESFLRDLRHAARLLLRKPTFTLVATLTLALGIGANATIFAMVSRFVLHSAPVGDPATLLSLHTTEHNECCNSFSWPLFTDVCDTAHSFSGVTGFVELLPASISGNGDPQRLWGQATTTNFFDVTQLPLTLGRGFRSDEQNSPVIVLGNRVWKSRFNSDPNIAGKSITLSGRPFTVIGVAPPYFRGLDLILDTQFWVPIGNIDQLLPNTSHFDSRVYHWIVVAARLKPGATQSEASAELILLAKRFADAHPDTDKNLGFRFEQAGSLPPRDKSTFLLFLSTLMLVVFLVLLIACANVANLILAQAAGRQHEMAVRIALGATRAQLLRQVLTESILLSLAGGVLGILISVWATSGLSAFRFPAPVTLDLDVGVDANVLVFTFLLSLITGALFGLLPAWTAAWRFPSTALKGEDVLARPGRFWTLRNFLVVAQIAMSLVLLCVTGLCLRSLRSAASIDIGFRSRGVLAMSVDPRLHGYTPERTVQFLAELQRRVSVLPGVASVAVTDSLPLSGGHRSDSFEVVGRKTIGQDPDVELFMASPGYFDTLGIHLTNGRDFSNESATSPRVAVINQALSEKLFPNENPIGQSVSGGGLTYEVIGVTNNIKARFLGEAPKPVLFRSLTQTIAADPSFEGYTLLVSARTAAAPSTLSFEGPRPMSAQSQSRASTRVPRTPLLRVGLGFLFSLGGRSLTSDNKQKEERASAPEKSSSLHVIPSAAPDQDRKFIIPSAARDLPLLASWVSHSESTKSGSLVPVLLRGSELQLRHNNQASRASALEESSSLHFEQQENPVIPHELREVSNSSLLRVLSAPNSVPFALDPSSLAPSVRAVIRELDPTLAVFNEQTMEHHLREAFFLPRLAGTLFAVFGTVGLLLAAIGLYGVMNYTVSLRTREIGIRMALGAQAKNVQSLILLQGLKLTAIALTIGLPAAYAVAQLFSSILYGIHPHDTLTFITIPLFLSLIAALAAYLPARRASQVDPASTLRSE